MARGVDRTDIFRDDEDRERYVRLLAMTARNFGWHLLAFCLMDNHIHLLVETTEANLGKAMHWLQMMYARTFNQRHGLSGHRFEARYRAPLPVTSDAKFLQLVGYIAVNPVDAWLVDHASDWRWSSHGLVSAGHRPAWLAHGRLLEHIHRITGLDCYYELIATHERLCRAPKAA